MIATKLRTPTQESFLRAWLNLDLLSDTAKFAPWLRRIVFGVSIDWLRVFRARWHDTLMRPRRSFRAGAVPTCRVLPADPRNDQGARLDTRDDLLQSTPLGWGPVAEEDRNSCVSPRSRHRPHRTGRPRLGPPSSPGRKHEQPGDPRLPPLTQHLWPRRQTLDVNLTAASVLPWDRSWRLRGLQCSWLQYPRRSGGKRRQ